MVPLQKLMCDSTWVEKQIAGFTSWLNYTFKKNNVSDSCEDQDCIESDRAASDMLVMKHLSQKRSEAKVRQAAVAAYAGLSGNLASLYHEVTEGRIAIREDRDILADLGLQETFLKLLFSYELSWLRLGLEVVFGEIFSLLPNSKRLSENEATQV